MLEGSVTVTNCV